MNEILKDYGDKFIRGEWEKAVEKAEENPESQELKDEAVKWSDLMFNLTPQVSPDDKGHF